MKRTVLFLIVFIFLFSSRLLAEEISLSLNEAVAIALRDSRDILLKSEEVKKAKQKITEARAGLLPALNFTSNWTDTRGFYPKDKVGIKTQGTLKQYLYQGGQVVNTIRYNKDGLIVSEALLDKTKLELVLNVQKAFYTLLLSERLAGLNKEILRNVYAHLASLKERYLNGQASQSDILSIKKSLSNIQQAYKAALNQIDSSASLLKNLLYLDDKIKIKTEAEFVYEPSELVYDEAFLKAMRSRPEIRQYQASLKQAEANIEIQKANTRPAIYASWDYYSNSLSQLTFSPTKAWNDYNVVRLTFSWSIFDGWETKAKIQQAILDLKEAQLTKEKTIRDIALELKNAYISLSNSVARIKANESDLAVYKDNLSAVKDKYNKGIASSLELEDANLGYSISLFNRNEAIYDYIIAKRSFDKAAGGL